MLITIIKKTKKRHDTVFKIIKKADCLRYRGMKFFNLRKGVTPKSRCKGHPTKALQSFLAPIVVNTWNNIPTSV